jgi:hypothetical protein
LASACIASSAAGCDKPGRPTRVAIQGPSTSHASTPLTAPVSSPAPTSNPAPSSAPAPATTLFDDKKHNVQFQYTSDWVSKPDKDYVLQLVPADGSGSGQVLFDVPDLPPHLPGMIRLGLIEHGYVGDLKETHKDAHTDSSADHPMQEGAKARLVESSWTQDGKPCKNVALLIMRSDHVYILSCRCDPDHLAATRAEFDKAAASLHWTK